MRIVDTVINDLVNDLGFKLSGGSLEIYDDTPPASPKTALPLFRVPLVVIPLGAPAFEPAIDGRAQGILGNPVTIQATGDATWARLKDALGNTIADIDIRAVDAEDAHEADLMMDRIDLHRGGRLATGGMTLRLPLSD